MHDGSISHYQWMNQNGLNFNEKEWIWYRPTGYAGQRPRTWSIRWVVPNGDPNQARWDWRCHWCERELGGSIHCPEETCQAMEELVGPDTYG